MKRIQIWPNHVAIKELDLVLVRDRAHTVRQTLARLRRMGVRAKHDDVEVHAGVRTD